MQRDRGGDYWGNSGGDLHDMIHIIGTSHRTQYWNNKLRQGKSGTEACAVTVGRFEGYLRDTATSLNAAIIAEELSKQCVDRFNGGSPASVAKVVAEELGLRHAYCNPNDEECIAWGVGERPEDREPIWMARIQPFSPNETSIIFVCGAEHSVSFQSLLERNSLHARIHCQDWTKTPAAQLSEDEINEWRRQALGDLFKRD